MVCCIVAGQTMLAKLLFKSNLLQLNGNKLLYKLLDTLLHHLNPNHNHNPNAKP